MEMISGVEGLLADRVGLRLDPTLRARLSRCVQEEVAAAEISVDEYTGRLEADPALFQRLLNRVTVQQSSFFRTPEQFQAIAGEVLPRLAGPFTVWSAGCGNGQEAYSLAMVLAESGIANWHVLATDISTAALERAHAGTYSEREVGGITSERLARHMRPCAGGWEVAAELRRRVEFAHHNLASQSPPVPQAACRLVMCRNVLIYFGPDDLTRALDRLASCLHPEGLLFLGGSESLWQVSDRLRLTRIGEAFAYQLATTAQAPDLPGSGAGSPTALELPAMTVAQLLAEGDAAIADGNPVAATRAFERATLLDPDHPVPFFQLALCHERSGRPSAARRAFSGALAAIGRCDTPRIEAALEGYRLEELVNIINLRLERS